MKKILLSLLIVSLSLCCLLIAVENQAFNIREYTDNYLRHGIQDVTGKSYSELESITKDLFQYLKGKAGREILEPNFNQREILHMEDVQVLFKYGFILKYVSIILSLGIILFFSIREESKLLGKWILRGLFVNWGILGILGIMIYFDFNKYFTYFHQIFFTNDLWLLDPKTDLLIQMLPEKFFNTMALKIGVSFLGFLGTIQGIGYAIAKKGREKNEKGFKFF